MEFYFRKYGSLEFDTIYFGGGTPSLLSEQEMSDLFFVIKKFFRVKKEAEITCEWNPGDGNREKIKIFAELGINRISLGAQGFDDGLLKRIGRRHTAKETMQAIENFHDAGIKNISLDLMLRLPGQRVEDFESSALKAIEQNVSQVSLYDLEIYGDTVFGRRQRNNKLILPDENVHAAMYQAAINFLCGAGYEQYEISNFAKPGFASRHNLLYWHNKEYLGVGAGAFSYIDGIRFQFAPTMKIWFEKHRLKDFAADVADKLSPKDIAKETFAMNLRLAEGAEVLPIEEKFPSMKERIKVLREEKLLNKKDGRVFLTTRGKCVAENVFSFLLEKDDVL